jgi:hypothetical protein
LRNLGESHTVRVSSLMKEFEEEMALKEAGKVELQQEIVELKQGTRYRLSSPVVTGSQLTTPVITYSQLALVSL